MRGMIVVAIAAIFSTAAAHECDSPKSKDCNEFFSCCLAVCDNKYKELGCGYKSTETGGFEVTGTCVCRVVLQSSIDVDAYRQAVLDAHNTYRGQHGAPAMTLDADLNTAAQAWAKELATVKHTLEHSADRDNVGENAAMSTDMPTGESTSAMWYNEISLYDYNNPGFSAETGHFTQLVWKDSTKLGVGIYSDEANAVVYSIAQYGPAGNVGGSNEAENYRTNVLPKS